MRRLRAMTAGLALTMCLVMAGCSPSAIDDPTTEAGLQDRVLAVSVALAAEDWQAASGTLDALEVDVATALTNGAITDDRAAAIRAAIAVLRDDIAAELDPERDQTPSPTPSSASPEPDRPGNGGDDDDKETGNDKKD